MNWLVLYKWVMSSRIAQALGLIVGFFVWLTVRDMKQRSKGAEGALAEAKRNDHEMADQLRNASDGSFRRVVRPETIIYRD